MLRPFFPGHSVSHRSGAPPGSVSPDHSLQPEPRLPSPAVFGGCNSCRRDFLSSREADAAGSSSAGNRNPSLLPHHPRSLDSGTACAGGASSFARRHHCRSQEISTESAPSSRYAYRNALSGLPLSLECTGLSPPKCNRLVTPVTVLASFCVQSSNLLLPFWESEWYR